MKASSLIKGNSYVDSTSPDEIYEYVRLSKVFVGEHYFESVDGRIPRVLTSKEVETDIIELKELSNES